MKTGYVIASTIAFAVSCTLTNAMPFSPTAIPNSLKGIANNRDVAPIVEPAIIFKRPVKPRITAAGLRGSQPLFEEKRNNLPMALWALPMQPYLQLASLPLNTPIPDVGEQASLRSLAPPEKRLPKASWAKLRRSTLAPMALWALPMQPYLQLASLPLNALIPDVGEQTSLRSLAPPEKRLPKASWAKLRRSTLAPMAFVRYCNQNKAKCETRGASRIKLSSTTLSLIDRVNRDVNRAILPQNESKDVWRDNVKVGDCEDFALTKRAQLVRMGFSSAALRMAVAKTPRGEGHAVLVVSTTRGDFVLDNRNNEIRPFQHTDLTWVKMQGSKGPLLWHRI